MRTQDRHKTHWAVTSIAQAVIGMALATGASAEEVITDPISLASDLAHAEPGDVLLLEPGLYSTVAVSRVQATAEDPIVLRSRDPNQPAQVSRLSVTNSAHVHLDTMLFDYTFVSGDPSYLRPFQINNSQHIQVSGSVFDGDVARGVSEVDDGFGTAFGLGIRGSAHVAIVQNEIRGFFRGLIAHESTDLLVQGNDLYDLRMDGMNFAQVQSVLVEGNHIHDFTRSLASGDHADFIQFWTNQTTAPSRDIVVRNNLLNSGDGWYTQSIFMRNEEVDQGRAGREMFYQNVLIENNLIINAHLHGITVGETDGLIIRNNTVVRNPASADGEDNLSLWTPQILVSEGTQHAQIERNVTSRISGYANQPNWQVTNNIIVQDQGRAVPNHYSLVFEYGDPKLPSSFRPLPGGVLDGTGIGATFHPLPLP